MYCNTQVPTQVQQKPFNNVVQQYVPRYLPRHNNHFAQTCFKFGGQILNFGAPKNNCENVNQTRLSAPTASASTAFLSPLIVIMKTNPIQKLSRFPLFIVSSEKYMSARFQAFSLSQTRIDCSSLWQFTSSTSRLVRVKWLLNPRSIMQSAAMASSEKISFELFHC